MTGEERKMRIFVAGGMSRGKYAAQAVHAALLAVGAHPDVPVVVLGASRSEIEGMRTVVHDAGRTEVPPGTITAGTDWVPEAVIGEGVNTEDLRKLAKDLYYAFLDFTDPHETALIAAADEIDRLRQVIKAAPHGPDCACTTLATWDEFFPCSCWKAAAQEGGQRADG